MVGDSGVQSAGGRLARTLAALLFTFPALVVALCPTVGAYGPVADDTMDIASFEATGQVLAQADLVGAQFDSLPGKPPIGMQLQGSVIVSRTAFESVRPARVDSERQDAGLRRADLRDATLVGHSMDADASLTVFAAPHHATASILSSGVQVEREIAGTLSEPRFVESRVPSLVAPIANTLSLRTEGATQLRISGSFVLVAWGWDFVGSEAGAVRFLSSGPGRPLGSLLAYGSDSSVPERREQLYLAVSEGTLDVEATGAAAIGIWGETVSLHSAETVAAQDLQGHLLRAERLPLRWHLKDFAASDEFWLRPSRATATGISLASSGTHSFVALGVEAQLPMPLWMRPSALAVMALVVLPAGTAFAVTARRRMENSSFSELEDAVDSGDAGTTIRLSERLLGSRHFGKDAALMRVEALVRLHRLDEARRALSSMPTDSDSHWSSSVELLRAYLHAVSGDPQGAGDALARCLELNPDLYEEICDNPVFAGSRSVESFRRVLARITSGGETR
jgi:hypothetical protein